MWYRFPLDHWSKVNRLSRHWVTGSSEFKTIFRSLFKMLRHPERVCVYQTLPHMVRHSSNTQSFGMVGVKRGCGGESRYRFIGAIVSLFAEG